MEDRRIDTDFEQQRRKGTKADVKIFSEKPLNPKNTRGEGVVDIG